MADGSEPSPLRTAARILIVESRRLREESARLCEVATRTRENSARLLRRMAAR